jgi:hypothetical protein
MPQIFANNVFALLAQPAASGDTTLTLDDASAFPALSGDGDFYLVTLASYSPENGQEFIWEICQVTAQVGNDLTVVRGREGTTAKTWGAHTPVEMRVTAGVITSIRDTAVQGAVGAAQANAGLAALSPLASSGSYADLQDVPVADETQDGIMSATAYAVLQAHTVAIEGLHGRGGALPHNDFGEFADAASAQEPLTEYALQQIFGEGGTFTWDATDPAASTYEIDGATHTAAEIFNSTWVRNDYDIHDWYLTNTPDTTPAVFDWADIGANNVALATNSTAGIVRGVAALDGGIAVALDGTMTVGGWAALTARVTALEALVARVTALETALDTLIGLLAPEGKLVIPDDYITTAMLKDGIVTAQKLAANAVQTSKIADTVVTAPKLGTAVQNILDDETDAATHDYAADYVAP